MTDDPTRAFRSSIDEQVGGPDHTVRPAAGVAVTVRQAVARRRRNRIALAGTAMAVVLVAGVGVQTGSLPLARLDPARWVTDEQDRSELDTGVVRGNLAGDDRWLGQLREHVARVEGSGHEDVHVLYAADVDRWRTALVELPGRPFSMDFSRRQIWFAGTRGAPADALKQHGHQGGGGPKAALVLSGADGIQKSAGPVGRMAYVEVAAGGRPSKVAHSPTITARGVLSWQVRTLEPVAPGVYEDVVDLVGWGSYFVWDTGFVQWAHRGGPDRFDPPSPPSLAQGLGEPLYPPGSATAAPATPDAALVAKGFGQIRVRYGVDVEKLPRRLLWSGRMRGIGLTSDRDVTVLAVVLPSGAVALAKLDADPSEGGIETVLHPAAPLDRLILATGDVGNDLPFIEVLVPRGTTRLRVEDGGRVTTVPVRGSGVVSVQHDFGPDVPEDDGRHVKVTALGADGAPIASARVNGGISVGEDVYPPDPS